MALTFEYVPQENEEHQTESMGGIIYQACGENEPGTTCPEDGEKVCN